jgi:hypothetical protein
LTLIDTKKGDFDDAHKRSFEESGLAIIEIRQTEEEGLSAENSLEYDLDEIHK